MLVKETVPQAAGHMTDVLFHWGKNLAFPKQTNQTFKLTSVICGSLNIRRNLYLSLIILIRLSIIL